MSDPSLNHLFLKVISIQEFGRVRNSVVSIFPSMFCWRQVQRNLSKREARLGRKCLYARECTEKNYYKSNPNCPARNYTRAHMCLSCSLSNRKCIC